MPSDNPNIKSLVKMAQGGGGDLTGPPYRMPCGTLDDNFAASNPQKMNGTNTPYKVEFTKSGWRLTSSHVFTVCENGQPVQWTLFGNRAPSE